MNSKLLKQIIKRRLNAKHYYSRVAVEIPAENRIIYMTEPEIRALQSEVAMRVNLDGWEKTEAFISQFIVYNGRTKRGSKPMEWSKNIPGAFSTEFKPGFYDVNSNLAFELL